MRTPITVEFQIVPEFKTYLLKPDLQYQLELCPHTEEELHCELSQKYIYFHEMYSPSKDHFSINIPPKHSLILERPRNFFGFSSQEDMERLEIVSRITVLNIITADGRRSAKGKEILKLFKLNENRIWDINIQELK